MNLLAHLVLADPGRLASPLTLVGNLLPDFARDTPEFRGARAETHPDLPAAARAGVARHRLVDRVTDTHPAFLRLRARLTPAYGRFAGVTADLLLDYALSQRWDAATTSRPANDTTETQTSAAGLPRHPRANFIAHAHQALRSPEARAVMPSTMARTVDAMIENRWLDRYATAPGLDRTLLELSVRFSRRYRRRVVLPPIGNVLTQPQNDLLRDFDELWTALVARCANAKPGP